VNVGYVVPVRNEEKSLPDFLDSLVVSLDTGATGERYVIFVLNGCEDQSEDILRRFCDKRQRMIILSLPGKPGIMRAFRAGIYKLGPLGCYGKLDADICLAPSSLQDLEESLLLDPAVKASYCEPMPFPGMKDYLDLECGRPISYGERTYLEGRASLYRGDPFSGFKRDDSRLASLLCEDIFLSALLYTRHGPRSIQAAGTIFFRPPATRFDYGSMLKRTADELVRVNQQFPELSRALEVLDRPILDQCATNLIQQISAEMVWSEQGWARLVSTKGGRPKNIDSDVIVTSCDVNIQLAVVGCGNVSDQYLEALQTENIHITAIVDKEIGRARATKQRFNIPKAYASLQEAHDYHRLTHTIVLVPPAAQRDVVCESLSLGTHTYCEKPGGIDASQLSEMRTLASIKNVHLQFGPDTQLSPVWETARQLVANGRLGTVYRVSTQYLCSGHEVWHPRPDQFYGIGGGPLRDLGPYAISAVIGLLGRPNKLSCITQSDPNTVRQCQSGRIKISVPTHVFVMLNYDNALGIVEVGFRGPSGGHNPTYVHGTKGVLRLPSPEHHTGAISMSQSDRDNWEEISVAPSDKFIGRGQGAVAFLLNDLKQNDPIDCTLDIMGLCEKAASVGTLYVN
jgi:predicted dehydrogenase